MIEHAWTIMCRGSSVDRTSNNVTLFEIIEQLTVPADARPTQEDGVVVVVLNAQPPIFDLVTLWYKTPLEQPAHGHAKTEIRTPNGRIEPLHQYEVALTEKARARAVARIFGFPAAEPGLCEILVSFRETEAAEWRIVGRCPIQVQLPPPAPLAPPVVAEQVT